MTDYPFKPDPNLDLVLESPGVKAPSIRYLPFTVMSRPIRLTTRWDLSMVGAHVWIKWFSVSKTVTFANQPLDTW